MPRLLSKKLSVCFFRPFIISVFIRFHKGIVAAEKKNAVGAQRINSKIVIISYRSAMKSICLPPVFMCYYIDEHINKEK